uniref:Uncharacterized protein n=1 Tax=Panagrolaimus sp. ES5 TaxID=591445 RepID=A0AC34FY36_9BILA
KNVAAKIITDFQKYDFNPLAPHCFLKVLEEVLVSRFEDRDKYAQILAARGKLSYFDFQLFAFALDYDTSDEMNYILKSKEYERIKNVTPTFEHAQKEQNAEYLYEIWDDLKYLNFKIKPGHLHTLHVALEAIQARDIKIVTKKFSTTATKQFENLVIKLLKRLDNMNDASIESTISTDLLSMMLIVTDDPAIDPLWKFKRNDFTQLSPENLAAVAVLSDPEERGSFQSQRLGDSVFLDDLDDAELAEFSHTLGFVTKALLDEREAQEQKEEQQPGERCTFNVIDFDDVTMQMEETRPLVDPFEKEDTVSKLKKELEELMKKHEETLVQLKGTEEERDGLKRMPLEPATAANIVEKNMEKLNHVLAENESLKENSEQLNEAKEKLQRTVESLRKDLKKNLYVQENLANELATVKAHFKSLQNVQLLLDSERRAKEKLHAELEYLKADYAAEQTEAKEAWDKFLQENNRKLELEAEVAELKAKVESEIECVETINSEMKKAQEESVEAIRNESDKSYTLEQQRIHEDSEEISDAQVNTENAALETVSAVITSQNAPVETESHGSESDTTDEEVNVTFPAGVYNEDCNTLTESEIQIRLKQKRNFSRRKVGRCCCQKNARFHACWNMDNCKGHQFYHRFCIKKMYPEHQNDLALLESELRKQPWFCKYCTGEMLPPDFNSKGSFRTQKAPKKKAQKKAT